MPGQRRASPETRPGRLRKAALAAKPKKQTGGANTRTLDGTDIRRWMVRQGFAVAYRKYSKRYVEAEEAAKKAKIGVWQGPFVMPWEWRRGKRLVKPHE